MSSRDLLKDKIRDLFPEGKNMDKAVCVQELPYTVDDAEVKKYFEDTCGPVKAVEVIRSGALVFASAIVEFATKKGYKKSMDVLEMFGGEFSLIIIDAGAFLRDEIPMFRPGYGTKAPAQQSGGGCCVVQ